MDELALGMGANAAIQFGAMLAYINPGVGSFVLQAILVGLAGGYVLLKSSGQKLKAILMRRKPDQPPVGTGSEPDRHAIRGSEVSEERSKSTVGEAPD